MKIAQFQNKRLIAPVSFVTGLFLLLTVLVNPLFVNAESVEPKYLPYDYSWNYYALTDDQINQMLNMASSYIDITSDNLIIFWYEISDNSWLYEFCVAIVDDISYSSNKNYDSVNLTADYVTLHFSDSYIGFTDFNNIHDPGNQNYKPSSFLFFGQYSQLIQTSNLTTFKNMPLYGTVELDGDLIIGVPQSSEPVQGHAVQPDLTTSFLGNNADFGASISNSTFPNVPTVSHYNPNIYNPPAIDNSSVTTLLESLIDIIQYNLTYIINSIHGFVSSIITTIEDFGKYVGSIIAYVGKAIITNIQYAIQNLYDNLVSLFEPVLNFISEVLFGIKTIVDEIISLGSDENGNFSLTTLFVNLVIPDQEDLQDLIEDSDTFNVISVFSTINTKIRQEYATLQGLTSQKIIHVPSCIYHGQEIGDYDIDFSWYDRYKVLGDGIISAFLIWNYLWFLFFRFPYWLRGNSGDFSGIPPKGSD